MPRQLDAPPAYYNGGGPYNYAEGANIPVVDMPVVPQTAWWDAALLRYMLSERTWDNDDLLNRFRVTVANNTVDTLGIVSYTGAICAGYSIGFAKGEALTMGMRWIGTEPVDPPANATPYMSTMGTFADVTLGGIFAGVGITGGSLNVDNGVSPIVKLNDSLLYGGNTLAPVPSEIVAGVTTAHLTLQFHGNDIIWDSVFPGTIKIGNVTWQVNSMLCLTPTNNKQSKGRVIRTMEYMCMSGLPGGPVVQIY